MATMFSALHTYSPTLLISHMDTLTALLEEEEMSLILLVCLSSNSPLYHQVRVDSGKDWTEQSRRREQEEEDFERDRDGGPAICKHEIKKEVKKDVTKDVDGD